LIPTGTLGGKLGQQGSSSYKPQAIAEKQKSHQYLACEGLLDFGGSR